MNALDADENLTPLGYHLARLPLDPQMGKMILMGAIFGCIDPVFSVAACLSFKDPFYIPPGREASVMKRKQSFARHLKSDHLVFAEVIREWEESRRRHQDYKFCSYNFLSKSTLFMLRNMKQQFAKYLYEMNFLDSDDVKDPRMNVNSDNLSLVRAVVCAGLYPNVAYLKKCLFRKTELYTAEDGIVKIHPKSVNETECEFESLFLVYHEKMQSSSKYLHDTGMVYPLPLLLFGEGIKFSVKDNCEIVTVTDEIFFHCKENDAIVIQDLRNKLDELLEYKISNPGSIDWRQRNSEEAALLRAIIDLITSEERASLRFRK